MTTLPMRRAGGRVVIEPAKKPAKKTAAPSKAKEPSAAPSATEPTGSAS